MSNATDGAVHANQLYMNNSSSSITVLQATIMTSTMGSAAVGTAEPEHQYYTRQKAGRPKQGEKSINGAGQHQQQHWPAQHKSTTQQRGQLVWRANTTPTPPACSTAQQLRTVG